MHTESINVHGAIQQTSDDDSIHIISNILDKQLFLEYRAEFDNDDIK